MARIDLKVGYSCNDACVHCVVDDFRDLLREAHQRQDKTLEQLKAELTEARPRGDRVVVTGGEPTVRKDLPQILEHARDLGYAILLQSNGRRFAHPDFADRITAIAPLHYCIALHGPTAEVHDAVTLRPGSFAETVQGLRHLVARKQAVSAKIVLSKTNFAALPETVAFLADLGVPHVSIAFPHALGRARKLWDEVVPRYAEVAPFVRRALDVVRERGLTADAETFLYCHMEGYEAFVTEIHQQLEDYVELNQYGSGQGKVDWTRVRWEIKRKFPQCRRCRFDPVCEGPWTEYAEHFGGEEFVPVYGRRVEDVRELLDGRFRRQFPALEELPA